MPVPAFNEYRHVWKTASHPQPCSTRSRVSTTTWMHLAGRHDAVLLANPQNPSGVMAEYATMVDLVTKAAARNMYVLLDEAFIDYAREESLSAAVARFENLIVFRSVTKCFGIPGLRLAYAIIPERLRCQIEAYLPPWPISTLASIGTIAALQDEAFIAEFPSSNERRRVALARSLQALGLKVTQPPTPLFTACPKGPTRISFGGSS
ncbi:MAG: aminotransferase class I/II-fold pyridoxal phosphate-dependent enzyme [Bryobacteraceae bacterium]